ncbi:MAG: hypothetical protein ACI86M_000750 [Saprospiraceae bacterium]|jgi:uncharacterized protein YyaL (SSP411 family)
MKNTVIYICLILLISSCNKTTKPMDNKEHKFTNDLIHESSPYLLQHAHNPVEWHPWSDEVLKQAQTEDKLLIISIGYAACHWCHVMEHESFEDSLVAKIMNDNFICIKVDREERPDVDDVYMTACQLASGRGCGWPLNAFALPDGRPVWAGTYFPKDQWLNVLNQFKKLKEEDYNKLKETAEKITKGIQSFETIDMGNGAQSYTLKTLEEVKNDFVAKIDFEDGGRQGAPKFPMPNNYEFLLQYHYMTGDQRAMEAAKTTLDRMAKGGIYDQIGGGFARYSTDAYWIAPHFEKMLYDNSQLVSLYSHAYQLTKDPLYKNVVAQTIEFVERELMNKDFGFYSSLDADSEGVEGKFYVWQATEIDSIINNEETSKIYKDYYSIKKHGNWEHTNILVVNDQFKPEKHNKTDRQISSIIANSNKKLMAARDQRIRPGLDDKILTSWNGLMLKGYIDAYRAFGDEKYLNTALKNAAFITENSIQSDGSLKRNYKDGKSSINAFLDDYATVIDAFTALYEVTFDVQWLDKAEALTQHVEKHFFNSSDKMFYYTSDLDPALIARKMELSDNVIPASNSIMARNLFKLGTILYNQKMVDQAKQMLANMTKQVVQSKQPSYYSNWCQLMASMINPPHEVAVLGEDAVNKSRIIQRDYLPNAFFLGGKNEGDLELLKDKLQEGRTMIYVCQNKVCKIPTEDTGKAIGLID